MVTMPTMTRMVCMACGVWVALRVVVCVPVVVLSTDVVLCMVVRVWSHHSLLIP